MKRFGCYVSLLCFCFFPVFAHDFFTLQSVQQYAAVYPEHPPADDAVWVNPDYSTFHMQSLPTLFSRMLSTVGIGTVQRWNSAAFGALLHSVAAARKDLSGKQVACLTVSKGSRIFIWGDLHGAFHSLVRDLTHLNQEGVIDEQFRMQHADHYFVFNGDAINRSAYTLETLALLAVLIRANPHNVFYVRGKHEHNLHWHNSSLKRELKIRAASVSHEDIPFNSIVSDFFNTLPLALFVRLREKPDELIRISHEGRKSSWFDEQYLGDLLSGEVEQTLRYYDTVVVAPTDNLFDVKVLITTEEWREGIRIKNGLGLQDQDYGATTWAVLSSPITIHQKHLDFMHDAFAVIDMEASINDSTISLVNRQVETDESFAVDRVHRLVTGAKKGTAAFDQPVTRELWIGSTMALVTGIAIKGQSLKKGMSVALNEINRSGGINGTLLRTIILNDNYDPILARKNIVELMEQRGVDLIVLPAGSPTLKAYSDLVRDKKIAVLFPSTGSSAFRAPEMGGLVNLKASYADEVRILIQYVTKELYARKFAFFYQDDAYGRGPLALARKLLQEQGITEWVEIPYNRADVDFTAQAQTVRESDIDSIGFFAIPQAAKGFIEDIGVVPLSNKKLFGVSALSENPFKHFLDKKGLHFVFGAIIPSPYTSTLPIAQEYRSVMDANRYWYDVYSMEAYVAMELLIYALRSIDPPYTNEKLIAYLESVQNLNFKGMQLSYRPQERTLAQTMWIETGQDTAWPEYSIVSS